MDLSEGSSGLNNSQSIPVMIINLMGTKTNPDMNNRDYGVALRNKDPVTCVIGSLSFYFFSRFASQEWPKFATNRDWYEFKVLIFK